MGNYCCLWRQPVYLKDIRSYCSMLCIVNVLYTLCVKLHEGNRSTLWVYKCYLSQFWNVLKNVLFPALKDLQRRFYFWPGNVYFVSLLLKSKQCLINHTLPWGDCSYIKLYVELDSFPFLKSWWCRAVPVRNNAPRRALYFFIKDYSTARRHNSIFSYFACSVFQHTMKIADPPAHPALQ